MKKSSLRLLGILLIFLMLFTSGCGGSTQTDVKGFRYLSNEHLDYDAIMSTIKELSSEKYAGRLAGSEENKLAEDYIANYFEQIGLQKAKSLDSYKQTYKQYTMINNSIPILQIVDNGGTVVKDYVLPENFIYNSWLDRSSMNGEITAEGLLVKSKEELKNVKDKLDGKVLLLSKEVKAEYGGTRNIMMDVMGYGVKGVILEVSPGSQDYPFKNLTIYPFATNKSYYDNEKGPLFLSVEDTAFKEITNNVMLGNLIHLKADYSPTEVEPSNIIGVIPGSDAKLKNQYIIISAHMDSVGNNMNGTYNGGALDNTSGVATLMEIAKVIKEDKKQPKKTIIFIAFNGRNEDLQGSNNFVKNPIFPIKKDNTVVINLDMIGSKTVLPLTLVNYKALDTDLNQDFSKFAEELGIEVEQIIGSGCDDTPFGEAGIQAITATNLDITCGIGTPKDKVEDTVDKDRLGEIAKLVLYYIDHEAYKK